VAEPQALQRDKELLLGRLALRRRAVKAPRLVEALLIQSAGGMKRPIGELLTERGDLTPENVKQLLVLQAQARKLEDDEEAPAGEGPNPDPRLGMVIKGVRVDMRLEWRPLWATFAGRRAHDPEPVTLKLVDIAALRNGLWMDFLETVRACVKVKSPNVTEVLDVLRAESAFAIICRFNEGFSLQALLDKVRRIRLGESLRIAKEIAKGLRDLHKAGITHRALRPGVVWLPKKGPIQLQEAGLAFEPPGVHKIAERGAIFGSPYHMAPEVAKGELGDQRADTYALGCILYELLTGVRPFEGIGVADLVPQQINDPPLPPTKYFSDIPQAVTDFLLALMAKQKADRPADDAIVSTLEKLEAQAPKPGMTKKLDGP
jgi:serine/threonine protein kinase